MNSDSLETWSISAWLFWFREALDVGQRLVQRPQGVVEVCRAVGQHLRHRSDVVGELHDLLVAVGQRIDEHLQIADGAEQIGARVTEPTRGLRQLAQRLAERVAVAVERVGRLVDESRQRALHRTLLRSELSGQLRQLFLDLVPFDRDRRAIQPDLRAVGHHRAAGVGGCELNEPGRHQVWRDDQRLGIGGHLHPVLDRHGDLHVGCPRLDRVDGADRNTDDADLVTWVQAYRRGEVADHLVSGSRRPHHVHAREQHGHQRRGQCDARPTGTRRRRIGVCHGDFGLTSSRSEMYPRSMSARLSGSLPG